MSDRNQMAVLGAMLINSQHQESIIASLVADGLHADKFDGNLGAIANAILHNYHYRKPIDLITIGNAVRGHDGANQLMESCVDACATPAHASVYWQEVKEAWQKRTTRQILARSIADLDGDGGPPLAEVVADAQRALADVLIAPPEAQSMRDVAMGEIEKWLKPTHGAEQLRWPWPLLNEAIGPLADEYVVIAAQPSVGKTAFALAMAQHQAKAGRRVAMLSLESKREKIAARMIAQDAGVNTLYLRSGRGTDDEFARARAAAEGFDDTSFSITDESMTIEQIRAWAHREKHRGAKLLIVDNMKHIRTRQSYKNRFDQFAEVSLQLKFIRDDTGLPLVALHHLNSDDKLAWSSDIERDADIILMLAVNEEKTVLPTSENHYAGTWIIDVSCAKNREGQTGAIQLEFVKKYQRFVELRGPPAGVNVRSVVAD